MSIEKQKDLIDLLNDTRMCLIWLRILENKEYKGIINKVIKRIDFYIEQEEKDQYN